MFYPLKRYLIPCLLLIFAVLAITLPSPDTRPVQASDASAAEPFTPAACPLNSPPYSAGLEIIERTNFCIYYDQATTSNYSTGVLSLADATLAADHVEDYWDRYVNDFGFLPPAFTGKLEVLLQSGGSCNGGTSASWNYMYIYTECYGNPESIQKVLGHELFHRVQYSYDGAEVKWFKEGTARAIEDNTFDNIDNWATTLTAVSSSFNQQVNTYLASTNADITSDPMRYNSALWWKYFTEQYGSTVGEPQLGVNAFLSLWQQAATANDIAAVNGALSNLGAGVNFDAAFRQFAVANWTKDLTGVPNGSYNYIDEDQLGNGAPYGPLTPANGGTITTATSANWNGQSVSRYGVRYYSAIPSATDCPVVVASFTRTGGSTEFYHVVTQTGSTFKKHVAGSGASWTQSFLNDGLTRVVAIVGGQSNAATVNVSLSCANPVIDIELPNAGAPVYVGPSASPDNIVVQVSVTNGSPTGPVVGGLTNTDFSVAVGGVPALVIGGGFVQEEYFLLVDTPSQAANGPYDLEVFLEAPGTSTVIASDLEPDSVVYDNTNTDHVIVTDVSGSMGWDGKLLAAQHAANLFIDASNSSEGLGLVSYDHNVVNTLGIQFATLPHRNAAHNQVNAYVPGGATSIGDGLNEAVTLLGASPTGNARCQFTLLSDGMENSPLSWADVQAAVVGTGCPVMTVAFGAASNELLMQSIATATGGASYYNDVFVSSLASPDGSADDTELELGNTYLHALCEAQRCRRLFSTENTVSDYGQVVTHTLYVDDSVQDLTVVLDWRTFNQIPLAPDGGYEFALGLIAPDGTVYGPDQYAFENGGAGHVGFHINSPQPGEWGLLVLYFNEIPNRKYQVHAYGQTELAVHLLLPAVDGDYTTGDYVPLFAIWLPGGTVQAVVTAPDGTKTVVTLHDDGQHDDGVADDGFFGGLYTLVTQAPQVPPVDEAGVPNPPTPLSEGAYQVDVLAKAGSVQREARGAFAVPAGDDSNVDSVPDIFIETHCPSAPLSDHDLDQLTCSDEYFTGTDPNNSDTDGGGENDGSEVMHGLNPLNAADDQIEAPDFFHTAPLVGATWLTYDVKGEYQAMRLYRATSENGPWTLRVAELPLTGEYTDPGVNGTTYYYRLLAVDAENHGSAILNGASVRPSSDPFPPEAKVIINDGAPSTSERNVTLSFAPYEETNSYDDIVEMMLSNDPTFTGAQWQPFAQDVPWELAANTPGIAYVYARFRDAAGNESVVTEVGSILYNPSALYLPTVLKGN